MAGFPYGAAYGTAYYEGAGVSVLANIQQADVGFGGHPYMIDWGEMGQPALDFVSVPLTKEQYDTSPSPGEQSINPEAFWRRLRESWHLGAGQDDADREESSPFRFRSSTHADVWTKWQACLLNTTTAKTVSNATNQTLIIVGNRIYYLNGTALGYYTDIVGGSITPLTGLPGTQASSIATDGFNVITAHAASGVYKHTRGGANSSASHITGTVSLLGFVRGRFLAANANNVYDITSLTVGGGGALPAAIFTQGNTDFSWVGFAEGNGWLYAAGYSGDKSLIYKTQVREDGTALQQFSVAAELPDGEIVSSIKGYLGRFICIGTNKGWRLAIVTGSGDLSVGVRIDTPLPVLDFEPQGKFIWYGWGAYDSVNVLTGLGRFSTEDFVNLDLLQPAYASDLMVHGQQNNIRSVVTFNDRLVFIVDQIGMYYQSDNLEAEGWIDTGRITYGTNEPKLGLWFNLQHQGSFGEIEVKASPDEATFVSIGVRNASDQPMERMSLGETVGTSFEFRVMLRRDSVDLTAGPCLLSWLFRSQPKSEVTTMIIATVRLAPFVESLTPVDLVYDAYSEMDHIAALHSSREITTWVQSGRIYSVILEDYQGSFLRLVPNTDGLGETFNGSVTLKMKRI